MQARGTRTTARYSLVDHLDCSNVKHVNALSVIWTVQMSSIHLALPTRTAARSSRVEDHHQLLSLSQILSLALIHSLTHSLSHSSRYTHTRTLTDLSRSLSPAVALTLSLSLSPTQKLSLSLSLSDRGSVLPLGALRVRDRRQLLHGRRQRPDQPRPRLAYSLGFKVHIRQSRHI